MSNKLKVVTSMGYEVVVDAKYSEGTLGVDSMFEILSRWRFMPELSHVAVEKNLPFVSYELLGKVLDIFTEKLCETPYSELKPFTVLEILNTAEEMFLKQEKREIPNLWDLQLPEED